jgi:outer membrane protein assembly factor BamA
MHEDLAKRCETPGMVLPMPLCGGNRSHLLVPWIAAPGVLAALGTMGCYRVPSGKAHVADVTLAGTRNIDLSDLEEKLATRESPRFLGLFDGLVFEYEIYDEHALARDLQRIERYLRARGYYDARVRLARVYAPNVEAKNPRVYVTIGIEEGAPVLVDETRFQFEGELPHETLEAMRSEAEVLLSREKPLDETKLEQAEAAIRKVLTTTGYATARVARKAEVDLATRKAQIVFHVSPGRSGVFGPIRFEGLGDFPRNVIRQASKLVEGARYSSDDLARARQALLDLGVFASVDVQENLDDFEQTGVAPICISLQPAKVRSILVGGGIELDALKTDGHLQLGFQHGNFLGGLRKLDVRYKPGVVLYPTRIPTLEAPTAPLYEHRMSLTVRQPGFVEPETTGFFRAEYNIFPVLLAKPTENVLGYHELRGETGIERVFFGKLLVRPAYDLQSNFPFDYLGRVEGADRLMVSYAALTMQVDYRNDPVKPRRGAWFGFEAQFAGGPFEGAADDVRVQPDVRGYVPFGRSATLALRGSLGFVFPRNYARLAQENFANPGPSRAEGLGRDYQLLFFRGFFSGGPNSNRGYPIRGVGPHDYIPYLSPAGQSFAASGCNPNDEACFLPTGGLSLWEASAELRFDVTGPLAAALFCDAGDVSPFVLSVRPDRPHLSCGGGARYETPLGPVRLDVGARIPGMQYPSSASFELEPTPLLGLPIAIAFGLGESF